MASSSHQVLTGVSRLCAHPQLLGQENRSPGLVTNFTGTMPDLSRNVEALSAAGVRLSTLFSPEHGLWGSAQAGESEAGQVDEYSGLPVVDTYLTSGAALDELLIRSGISGVIVDFQEVGVRFYTYLWTLFDVMVSAARLGLPVTVLDRPNPLAFLGERGPGLDASCSSFVGRASIPLVHGRTIGELALRFNAVEVPELAGRAAELHVVELEGWDRSSVGSGRLGPNGTGIGGAAPWVSPSLNLPSLHAALAYAATCLFEGTNASEGRGTTHPFESVGAAYVDARLAAELRAAELPGILVREQFFVPTFSKWRGERVRGVQLHIVDPRAYDPVLTGVTMVETMVRLYPDDFAFLEPATADRPPFIDLLWGSDVLRTEPGAPLTRLLERSPKPRHPQNETLLYG